MSKLFLSVQYLSFSYEKTVIPIIKDFSCQFEPGWTGIVGANGCGKSTLLQLMTGMLRPISGTIHVPGLSIYCEQRTDFMPNGFSTFLQSYNETALRLKSILRIRMDWQDRWETLSHGERKRAQIAVAMAKEPDLLAIDEPSNHLDRSARQAVYESMKKYRGIGLLVSHDRMLLDGLCHHILLMDPPHLIFRKGNYTSIHRDIEQERAYDRRQVQTIRKKINKLQKEVHRRKHEAESADMKRSKKHLNPKDHDARTKKDLARLTGKDGVEGCAQKRLETQLERLNRKKESYEIRKKPAGGIRMPGNNAVSGQYIFHVPADCITMGDFQLEFPDLFIGWQQKIGLVGPNGGGKSALLNYLTVRIDLNEDQLIYIPQEIDVEDTKNIIHRVHALNGEEKGHMMAIISRLGSDPVRVLETALPSPGEVRKLMLADGIRKIPNLIIMDEPTNHMDLPSILSVETALADSRSAQLLVSHDDAFLKKTVNSYWHIEKTALNQYRLAVG
ncbi:ABC-F family ATP-binding cassette domain-containing protein [bacterium]|nr:ABC-F family ATP-binding cassette domain-containing protein [bacterium]